MRLDGQRDVRPVIAGLGIKVKNVKHLKVLSKVIGLQKYANISNRKLTNHHEEKIEFSGKEKHFFMIWISAFIISLNKCITHVCEMSH